MKLPSSAVVHVFTTNAATAKQKNVRSGAFKKARLPPEGCRFQIACMSAVGKLKENGLANKPRPRRNSRQSVASEGGRFGGPDLAWLAQGSEHGLHDLSSWGFQANNEPQARDILGNTKVSKPRHGNARRLQVL